MSNFKLIPRFIAVTLLILFLGVIGYSQLNKPATITKDNSIATSFYPIYFLTSEVASSTFKVDLIVTSNQEPHEYDLTATDLAKISRTKLFIVNGQVEPWLTKIAPILRENDVPLLILGTSLFSLTSQITNENDPHIWLSPVLAQDMVRKIETAIIALEPEKKEEIQQNATSLIERLNILDQEFKSGLKNCQQRSFVTSHAAFGYLSNTYNLVQVPVRGYSPETEPSAADLAQITKLIRENNTKIVFTEKLVSPKISATLAQETGTEMRVLDPIEGNDEQSNNDYFTIMRQNLAELQLALQCTP